jgi:hypothetical protein
MAIHNFTEDIEGLKRHNPDIDRDMIGILLTAQSLYRSAPDDLREFRERYGHMDPDVIENPHGILFLKMVHSTDPTAKIRERLNRYLNIKFSDITHPKSYALNIRTFREYCSIATQVIGDVLATAELPRDLVQVLSEQQGVADCGDFYELLRMYRISGTRTRFEILRKIGLIVLIARINRTIVVKELDQRIDDVQAALAKSLGAPSSKRNVFHFWINHENRVQINGDREQARRMHEEDTRLRLERMLPAFPLQTFECHPFQSPLGNNILMLSVRSKFRLNGELSYTSFIEKMLRKNLEYPDQVRDTIGVRLIVVTEDDVEKTIQELESFLGGTSTRKQEKNTFHKFGKRVLSRYSSDEYFVWKAIYDMPLPHPSIKNTELMLTKTEDPVMRRELASSLQYYIEHPRDFVIEVQLQDLKSYLQSIVKGSPTEHALLKKNQVRANSFYKLFPREIYEREISQLIGRFVNDRITIT